eukprot:scaffold111339_cov47-Phaeocystis_antarctica.AAC.2
MDIGAPALSDARSSPHQPPTSVRSSQLDANRPRISSADPAVPPRRWIAALAALRRRLDASAMLGATIGRLGSNELSLT